MGFLYFLRVIVVVGVAFSVPVQSASLPDLQNIRVGKTEARTRFVFDVSQATSYRFFELDNPVRAIIELKLNSLPGQAFPMPALNDTSIAAIGVETLTDGIVRYVFELRSTTTVNTFRLKPYGGRGDRIVLDIDNPVVGAGPGIAQEGAGFAAVGEPVVREADDELTEVDKEYPAVQDAAVVSTADQLFGFSDETTESRSGVSGIEGFFQFEAAHTYPTPEHLSKMRSIVELGTDGRFSDTISWKLSGRAAYDAVFELDDFYPNRVRDDRQFEAALYEAYLDISAGDLEFRLGRQHIIWGEMVGLFFADVVSAKDMRQFVAQDFDLIRIPQWAVRAEYFKGDYHAEVIWVPVMTYSNIGVPGDDFYPLGTQLPANTMQIKDPEEPSKSLSNGAYGVRLSTLKAGWDISGFYYRSVDVEPAFFSQRATEPEQSVVISPEHRKIHQFGATLAKDFGPVVLKSEFVYTRDRWFVVDDPGSRDGAVQQNTLDYVLALEHTTPGNTLLNFQVYQRWYTNYDSTILFDEFETGVSVFGKMEINNKLDAELTLISQLNRTDWMARPRVTWFFSDNWFMQVGVDVFGGESLGLFGRFEDSSRVYTNFRYTF